MMRTKIFKLLMVFAIGGFVLSTPFDVLASGCGENCKGDEKCYLCTSRDNPDLKSASYQCHAQWPDREKYICAYAQFWGYSGYVEGLLQKEIDRVEMTKNIKHSLNSAVDTDVVKFIKSNLSETGERAKDKVTLSGQTLKSYYQSDWNEAEKYRLAYNDMIGHLASKYKCDDDQLDERIIKNLLGSKSYSFSHYLTAVLGSCKSNTESEAFKKDRDKAIEIVREFDKFRASHHYLGDLSDDAFVYLYWYCVEKNANGTCIKLDSVEFIVDENYETITSVQGASQGCLPLPFKLYEARSCLFCPLFDVLFTAIQKASTEAYDMFGVPFARVLLIGLAIWIALMVLRHVSAMSEQKTLEFLTNLFANSFKVVIVYFLLVNSSIVYDIVIGPLLKSGFDFGMTFLERSRDSVDACVGESDSFIAGVFPNYIYQHLICFIKAVQYELAAVEAIGSSLMCVARHAARKDIAFVFHVMPDFAMMLKGAIVWLTAFVISIAFGFYLVDAIIQLGIFGMLLPLLLASSPFSLTRQYFNTGVGVFMNSWFIFVFMGLVTNLCVTLIGESLTNGQGGFAAVELAINGNDVNTLKNLLDYGSAGLVLLIACCVISIKLMEKVTSLASTLGDSGLNLGIGNKLGGVAASGVVNTAKWGAGKAGSAVKGIGNARIFGKDGKEWSIMDKVRGARHGAARAVGKGIGGVGKAVASPVRFTKSLFSGKNRRTPPTP